MFRDKSITEHTLRGWLAMTKKHLGLNQLTEIIFMAITNLIAGVKIFVSAPLICSELPLADTLAAFCSGY